MVSSSKGKDLIMWEIESGNKIISKKFMNEVSEICLENREKYIIITFASDNHLVVLDFISLDIVHVLAGHQARVVSLSFDQHFRQLLSLAKDRTARLWQFDRIMETETGTPKASSKVHKGAVLSIAYDRVKRKYATSHQNGEINLWSADENNLLEQVYSHNGPVKCLSFDRTGKLYSGGSDGILRIWNLDVRR
jgi:WD40 repeat protein